MTSTAESQTRKSTCAQIRPACVWAVEMSGEKKAFALMDRTRTLGCEQGCCGTRLPTREAQVRVLYRLRGAAKHEDRSDSLMQPPFQHKRPSFKEKKGLGGSYS